MNLFKTSFYLAIAFLMLLAIPITGITSHNQDRACTKSAKFLKYACGFEARDDYLSTIAICLNESDGDNKKECLRDARIAQKEAYKECREVLKARKSLCANIGEEPYDPPFSEDFSQDFVDPREIGKTVTPNPYFPLIAGNQWIFEGTSINEEGEEETETVTVTVTEDTKLINGINCVTVIDVAEVDEEIQEITDDWYAQDVYGNVWYCGEVSRNFEVFEGDEPENPELVDLEGSWKAGRDGAKAGILLPSVPQVGDVIRQEVAWGDAEDVIEILATDASEAAPAASCTNSCLQTYDFTPLDSEAQEHKFYVPGIGLIVEVDLTTGDRVELIEFSNTS